MFPCRQGLREPGLACGFGLDTSRKFRDVVWPDAIASGPSMPIKTLRAQAWRNHATLVAVAAGMVEILKSRTRDKIHATYAWWNASRRYFR